MRNIYEQALLEVGGEGRYQKSFDLTYNVMLIFFWSMAHMNIILSLSVIPYTCKLPEKTDLNVSDYSWKLKHIPTHEDLSGDVKFESCSIYVNPGVDNVTKKCESYTYDHTWFGSTIPSDKNWVCEKEINVANVFAYSKIGEAVGSVFFGWLGDNYGRRPTYILSLVVVILGRAISLFAGASYTIFAMSCIFATFPSWSIPQSVSLISMEMSTTARRTVTTSLRYTAFSIGLAVMAFCYWWLRDWQLFVIVTTAPLIPWIIFSWKIPESSRWLCVMGKSDKCLKMLQKIGKANNQQLCSETEKELLKTHIEESRNAFGPLTLLSKKRIAFNTILLLILWTFVSISYGVLLFTAGETKNSNPFIQFAIQSIAEIPANFMGAWLCDHFGRRRSATTSFFIMAIIWGFIYMREFTTFGWIQVWWINSALVAIGRLNLSIAFFAINLMNIEIYPTSLRSSGLCLGNVVSSVAAGMSPYVLYLGRRVDSRLPGLILCSTCLVSALSGMFLPETMNMKLPETIEDANNLGRKNNEYEKVALKTTAVDFT